MEVFALANSAYLALEALPLLLTPRMIVSMTVVEPRRITDLETYLCRSFGLTLLLLSALILLLSNTLPIATGPVSVDETTEDPSRPSNAYAYPTVLVTTVYHACTGFYLYANLTYNWNFAFTCGLIGSSALFCLGMWVVLFAGGPKSLSKTTGADKRTSGFPFASAESARAIKKEKRRSVGKTSARST